MSNLNLYQKIVEVRKAVNGLSKDKEGYKYQYVTGNQILAKVKETMNQHNLLLIPATKVGEWDLFNYTNSNGQEKTDFVVRGEMRYTWINGDNPEENMEVAWAYYGQQDDISKAYGSALTYSERYFWLKVLGLPTDDDDPDGNQGDRTTGTRGQGSGQRQGSAPAQNGGTAGKKISEGQVKRIFALVKGNKQAIKKALADFNIPKEEDILVSQYEEFCKRAIAHTMTEEAPEEPKTEMITEAQKQALYDLADALRLSKTEMADTMKERYKDAHGKPIQSSLQLTKEQADDLIKHIENREFQQAVG